MSSRGIVDLRPKLGGERLVPVRFAPKNPRRESPLRSRRRKIRIAALVIGLVALGAGVYGVRWLSYLPQYNVQNVRVSGTQVLSPRLVQAYVESEMQPRTRAFLSPRNIFLLHPSVIERNITSFFPRIKSAQVSRESLMATVLNVAVTERDPYALWCSETDCYEMDEEGFVFASASSTGGVSSLVFRGAPPGAMNASSTSPIGHVYASAHFPGILALLRYLGQAGITAQGATIIDDRDFTVLLAEGFYLKASFGEDASALAGNLKLVLSSDALKGKESKLEYVDLRFGNRIYYKLQGQAEAGN